MATPEPSRLAPEVATVGRGALSLLLSRIANRGLLLLLVIIATRVLGPEDWGRFTLALSLLWVLRSLLHFSFEILLTREMAAYPHQAGSYFIQGTLLKLLLAAALLPAVALALWVLSYSAYHLAVFLTLGVSLALGAVPTSAYAFYNAQGRFGRTSWLQSLEAFLCVVAGLLALRLSPSALALAIGFLAASAAMMVGCGFLVLRDLDTERAAPKRWKGILRALAPFAAANLLVVLSERMDVLLVSFLGGDRAAGLYSAAFNFLDGLMLLPVALATALYPWLSTSAADSDRSSVQDTLFRSFKYLFVVSLVAATVASQWSEPVVRLLYGAGYAESAPVLKVLLLVPVFLFQTTLFGYVLYAVRAERTVLRLLVFHLAISLAFNLALIPGWGVVGAASAKLVANFASFLLCLYLLADYLPPRRLLAVYAQGALAVIPALPLLWIRGINPWMHLALFFALSIAIVLALELISVLESRWWRERWRLRMLG